MSHPFPVVICGPMSEPMPANYPQVSTRSTPDRITKEVQMLAPGTITDATGKQFTWTAADMQAYVDNFDPQDHPPILLDHELSARATVGRLRGLRVQDKPGIGPVLMGLWEILGAENVARVLDGRWSRTSGRFGMGPTRAAKKVIEGSIVWRGAYDRGHGDRAQILGAFATLAAAPLTEQPKPKEIDMSAIMKELENTRQEALNLSRSPDAVTRAKAAGIVAECNALLKSQADAEHQAELSAWLGMADWGKKPA